MQEKHIDIEQLKAVFLELADQIQEIGAGLPKGWNEAMKTAINTLDYESDNQQQNLHSESSIATRTSFSDALGSSESALVQAHENGK